MFNQTAQIVLMLAAGSAKATLHSCNMSFQDLVECVLKSEISSFHYVDQNSTALKCIEIACEELAEFVIQFGENSLPLHIYNVTDKTVVIIKEEMLQGINQGTFVFRNCRGEDIHEIVSCFGSLSNWKSFNLRRGVTIQKSVFQQIAPVLSQKVLSQFTLSLCCTDHAAVAVTDVLKNSTSLQYPSLMNCKLCNQMLDYQGSISYII